MKVLTSLFISYITLWRCAKVRSLALSGLQGDSDCLFTGQSEIRIFLTAPANFLIFFLMHRDVSSLILTSFTSFKFSGRLHGNNSAKADDLDLLQLTFVESQWPQALSTIVKHSCWVFKDRERTDRLIRRLSKMLSSLYYLQFPTCPLLPLGVPVSAIRAYVVLMICNAWFFSHLCYTSYTSYECSMGFSFSFLL